MFLREVSHYSPILKIFPKLYICTVSDFKNRRNMAKFASAKIDPREN